jgi:hypothetical protein
MKQYAGVAALLLMTLLTSRVGTGLTPRPPRLSGLGLGVALLSQSVVFVLGLFLPCSSRMAAGGGGLRWRRSPCSGSAGIAWAIFTNLRLLTPAGRVTSALWAQGFLPAAEGLRPLPSSGATGTSSADLFFPAASVFVVLAAPVSSSSSGCARTRRSCSAFLSRGRRGVGVRVYPCAPEPTAFLVRRSYSSSAQA